MKMQLIRAMELKDLFDNVESNLDRYRHGRFEYLIDDSSRSLQTNIEIDNDMISKIDCTLNNSEEEIKNCVLLFDSITDLTPYLARDERFWVYLSHTYLLDYSRKRWPIPEDPQKAIEFIHLHYFVSGARGFERDNSVSRLWWMASLSKRVISLPLEKVLQSFLYMSDVRANIIERPTTSQNTEVFSAILEILHESYCSDKALFERELFRKLMKNLNLRGGTQLLDVLNKNDIKKILKEYI
jgi:hypothetical protein